MNLNVEIDTQSGFCYGVIRAINTAEKNLDNNGLYSLGAIVHNNEELGRLNAIGLKVIDIEQMRKMRDTTVLIRAHGEPPQTYEVARQNNIKLIDCTCPVVLKLQEKIRNTYSEIRQNRDNPCGQIVIFGKEGHAEVNGLVGQVNGDAVIVDVIHAENGISFKGIDKIDYMRPVHIFSQTTKDPKEYVTICEEIRSNISQARNCTLEEADRYIKIHNTICRQVAQRHENLVEFARRHSVIIFVSGKESSNGKVLYDLCKSVNKNSYHIQNTGQIESWWFKENDSAGICGATSTPKWQLENVAEYLKNL